MADLITLLAEDAVGLFAGALSLPWGIYYGGAPVVIADNVISFDYRQQSSISDFPVEEGSFQSYDKVAIPYDARIRFTAGGPEVARQALLTSIAAIAGDLNLYDIVTPTAVYLNANVVHYDYTRRANSGLGLLVVDVWLLEVRIAVGAVLSNTQSPANASQVNAGPVQTTAPTPNQAAQLPFVDGPPEVPEPGV